MFEEIKNGKELLAIIVRSTYHQDGVKFFTPDNLSQQLAYMSHPAGKLIEPHRHNPVSRNVLYTKEVLIIKTGSLRVDFFTEEQDYVCSRILVSGDVILLSAGGHGFEVLENLEMIEVKQGPYTREKDKICFQHDITSYKIGE